MGIVGDKPESGVRIELERDRDGGPPWIYGGDAVTPEARVPVRVTVSSDGAVEVDGVDAALAGKIKLIVRMAYKHAQDDEVNAPPPRRIVRWRGEK